MKISKEDFLILQEEWYDKLKKTGFEDIEKNYRGNNFLKNHRYPNLDPDAITYFDNILFFADAANTIFKKPADKIIMQLHGQGMGINDIIQALSLYGIKRARNSVRIIIRRYEMAWGIKEYTRKQLNLKEMR